MSSETKKNPSSFATIAGTAILSGSLLIGGLSCGSAAAADDAKELPRAAIDLPAPAADQTKQTAVLGMGCFWCGEAVFEQLKGVSEVTAGYAGGTKETANYQDYHQSNHAEAIRIVYDPHQITFGELIRVLFTIGDPMVKDGQPPDMGHGYRMAIFYDNDDQKRVGEAYIKQLNDAKVFKKPIQATVEPYPNGFFPAEDYHQHYAANHPDQPYVKACPLAKVAKVRDHFKDEVKP